MLRSALVALTAGLSAALATAAPATGQATQATQATQTNVATANAVATSSGDGVPTLATARGAAKTDRRGRTAAAAIARSLLRHGHDATVGLDLAPGHRRVAQLRAAEDVAGFAHWSGALDGIPDSTVTVVQKDGLTSGVVNSPEGTYRFTSTSTSAAEIRQVAADAPDRDLVVAPPATAAAAARRDIARITGAAAADTPTTPGAYIVDIVIGWTAATESQLGGPAPSGALAALSVATSNDAYAASGVSMRLRLLGTVRTTSAEGNFTSDLAALAAPNDGRFDDVIALRTSRGADLAALLIKDDPASPYCGIAYYPGGPAWGVAMISQTCAVDNLSFPHEVGHNLGASHDRYAVAKYSSSAYYAAYGYGYSNVPGRFRTIMAYADDCLDQGVACTRIARFSNPALTYNGGITGLAPGRADAADNHLAILNSALYVSGYANAYGPRVSSSTPVHGIRGVSPTAPVTATFANSVTGVSASTFTVTIGGVAQSGTVSYDTATRTAKWQPTSGLTPDVWAVATLTPGITNGGVPLNTTTWAFHTGPAPAVTLRSPVHNARSVSPTANVTLTFSEPVTGVSASTFYLTTSAGARIPAAVTGSGATWTIDPTVSLTARTTVYVNVVGGSTAVRDLSGNPAASSRASFVVGPAPAVEYRFPPVNGTNVGRANSMTVRFTTEVAGVASTTFFLTDTVTGARVAGVVSKTAARTWVMNPTATLAANRTYTVSLVGATNCIRDLAGNPLVTTSWSFRTGA